MSEERKTRIGHYKFDIILISSALVIALVLNICVSIFWYVAGLKGNPFYVVLIGLPLELLLICLFVVLLIIAFVNLIKVIIKIYKVKKIEWLRVFSCLVPFFVGVVLYVSPKPGAGAIYFLQGYEKWVQKEVDIASIQKWLMSVDAVYSDRQFFEDFPQGLPATITRLKPHHMYFGKFDAENRSVEFEWENALGCWGIRIGLPHMETPKKEYIKESESTWEWGYRHPIQPGVYIFERVRRN